METERDLKLYDLIAKFKVINSRQIYELIYKKPTQLAPNGTSDQFMRRRLATLVERKELKRVRQHIDQHYVYYQGKCPDQIKHRLTLVDAYIALGEPKVFDVEYKGIDGVRPDAYCEIIKNNRLYSFFVEIHRFNGFDFDKYIRLYNNDYTKYFHTFPRVIIISSRGCTPPTSPIRFYVVDSDLKGVEKVFT